MKKPVSWSTRMKRSAAMKARWEDPDFRERHGAGVRGWARDDAYKQTMSASKRGKPLSKSHVAAIRAGKARRKAEKSAGE